MNNLLQIGEAQAQWNSSGTRILKYFVEMYHSGLNEHKVISAPDIQMLENKAELQAAKWQEKWEIIDHKLKIQEQHKIDSGEAERLTKEAQTKLEELNSILSSALKFNNSIDWETIKRHELFTEKKPVEPLEIDLIKLPSKPEPDWPEYIPHYTIFESIFSSLKKKKLNRLNIKLINDQDVWQQKVDKINRHNANLIKKQEALIDDWSNECKKWENKKNDFLARQNKYNESIDLLHEKYNECESNAVEQYCEIVLNNSKYPSWFTKDFELQYNLDSKILICEYYQITPEQLPKLKEVKYISSRNEMKETFLTETQIEKNYDKLIYQIILRSIHELFVSDTVNAIESISFNTRVRFISKATGHEEEACIASMHVKKVDFLKIDLLNVDPKICFKSLKGIGSSKLSGITPIKPILQIDKKDRRFVSSHNVADGLDDSTNIAAMDWEEFEHLIRELFEKEFSEDGGEVKITQASRDGGVDAVAFDPDPIRGGKIVIQAKRYTNTVGVAAVRDLYGTVVNEGAIKGILVTTADYGPDAYEFAKNKPLTLLNGGNLLHLLEKHGHKVKIDIKEARKILNLK